jgi:hypothetical protein
MNRNIAVELLVTSAVFDLATKFATARGENEGIPRTDARGDVSADDLRKAADMLKVLRPQVMEFFRSPRELRMWRRR